MDKPFPHIFLLFALLLVFSCTEKKKNEQQAVTVSSPWDLAKEIFHQLLLILSTKELMSFTK